VAVTEGLLSWILWAILGGVGFGVGMRVARIYQRWIDMMILDMALAVAQYLGILEYRGEVAHVHDGDTVLFRRPDDGATIHFDVRNGTLHEVEDEPDSLAEQRKRLRKLA
jgi:hypothetical protein